MKFPCPVRVGDWLYIAKDQGVLDALRAPVFRLDFAAAARVAPSFPASMGVRKALRMAQEQARMSPTTNYSGPQGKE